MGRDRQWRAWSRLAAALTLGLALVAGPSALASSLQAPAHDAGVATLAPMAAHAVAVVLRAGPASPPATKHATHDWALAAPTALAMLLVGWTAVRRRGFRSPASGTPCRIAARAPPSTVGF